MSPRAGPWRGFVGRWLAVTLVVAGLVHLGVVLRQSRRGGDDVYARLVAMGGGAGLLVTHAVPPAAARTLPFADPAMALAFCVFDLRDGPVDVVLPADPLDLLLLSVHDGQGAPAYALTNRSAVGGTIALSIVTPAAAAAAKADDEDGGGVRVAMAGNTGFVLAQALAATVSQRGEAAAAAGALQCRPGRER